MKISIGMRVGFVLFEPGYHVSRAIVVMLDGLYPHTSWFVQSSTPRSKKEYCYEVINEKFIAWKVRETKNEIVNEFANLIYVKRAFGKCLSITEKRSLFYTFKSLVLRNEQGVVAGMYCLMNTNTITLFYPENNEQKQIKIKIDLIENESTEQSLKKLANVFSTNSKSTMKQLQSILKSFKKVLEDREFIRQMMLLDQWIEEDA
ncbi:hypothetical protein B4U80_00927 [Leptotrombidium deliense]|uniref:Uncharacterized protein n=1 Tax=Leptotrombidium deliense TaxID=299467 RepID=A0A443SB43_9ACAR|nr:hypothetical protein B4U80_00927 [Leptotrombidium deliense]